MPRYSLTNKSACLIIIPTVGASLDGMIAPGRSYPVDEAMFNGDFVQNLIDLGDLSYREIEDGEAESLIEANKQAEALRLAKANSGDDDDEDGDKGGNGDGDQGELAEIEALRAQCVDLGISVDNRWKVAGLKKAIAAA